MTRKIYLIRHGETDLNKAKCFYGSLDVSINNTGKRQAMSLKEAFLEINPDNIFISGKKRTKETADIVFPNQAKIIEERFAEKGFGEWEGLDANEIEKLYPEEWQKWLDNPFGYTPPEAESFSEFKKRVLTAYQEIVATTTDNVVIISHLGVIRTIVSYASSIDDFWSINLEQDAWLELEIKK